MAGLTARVSREVDARLGVRLAAATVLRAKAGSARATLEFAAFDNLAGGAASSAKLSADSIFLDAESIEADALGRIRLKVKSGGGIIVDRNGVSFDGASVPRVWRRLWRGSHNVVGQLNFQNLTGLAYVKSSYDDLLLICDQGTSGSGGRCNVWVPDDIINTTIHALNAYGNNRGQLISCRMRITAGILQVASFSSGTFQVREVWGVNN